MLAILWQSRGVFWKRVKNTANSSNLLKKVTSIAPIQIRGCLHWGANVKTHMLAILWQSQDVLWKRVNRRFFQSSREGHDHSTNTDTGMPSMWLKWWLKVENKGGLIALNLSRLTFKNTYSEPLHTTQINS